MDDRSVGVHSTTLLYCKQKFKNVFTKNINEILVYVPHYIKKQVTKLMQMQ